MTYSISKRKFDVVIVGAGGSGMRASLQLARAGLNVAVLSKVFPYAVPYRRRAQGGIGASLGNMNEDNWHYHFLRHRQRARTGWATRMPSSSCAAKHPKSCTTLSTWACRSTATRTVRFTSGPLAGTPRTTVRKAVERACAAADRTGHAMLHTLYQQNVKARTAFFVEWMALDLIRDCRWRRGRRDRAGDGNRRPAHTAGQDNHAGHRRGRTYFCRIHQRLHQHRRRTGHGRARGSGARGHGVLAVSPNRRCRCRCICSPKVAAAKARSSSTAMANVSWSVMPPRSKILRRATSCRAAWTRKSRKAADVVLTRTTCCSSSTTWAPTQS